MRQPLWLINLSLLGILFISEFIFLLIQNAIPRRFSLVPGEVTIKEKKIAFDVDIAKIYETNDLFGTYVDQTLTSPLKNIDESIPPIPQPPAAIPLEIPIEKPPIFIAPLAATLKGIIYLHDDSEESTAIIQLNDSKNEANYKVGEMILDAQILKIFPNRIIVVRSNGQQETLYLRPKDLEKDFQLEMHKNNNALIILTKDNKRYVPIEAFLQQINSLGQFIDLLALRVVYQQGKIVGYRIGAIEKDSIGAQLGFEKNDLIKKIDSIVIDDLNSKIKAYDLIINKKVGDEIIVEIDRNTKQLSLTFVLSQSNGLQKAIAQGSKTKAQDLSEKNMPTLLMNEEEKQKILAQKIKLAPTAHQLERNEQRKLMDARKKNMLSRQQPV
ncbi:hypothetical protein HYV11_03345 [Candidatus Dependentiae bacterium]|nr:hypothetical protein [Candidatus Dependentiae bacterium]